MWYSFVNKKKETMSAEKKENSEKITQHFKNVRKEFSQGFETFWDHLSEGFKATGYEFKIEKLPVESEHLYNKFLIRFSDIKNRTVVCYIYPNGTIDIDCKKNSTSVNLVKYSLLESGRLEKIPTFIIAYLES